MNSQCYTKTTVHHRLIDTPDSQGDGLVMTGEMSPFRVNDVKISFNFYHFSNKKAILDENFSTVNGAYGTVENCVFSHGIKLVLCGNGDYPEEDSKHGSVTFKNCIFDTFGRRGIEVQDGVHAFLENCIICNWGDKDYFDVRSFATWVHSNGFVRIKNCIFLNDVNPFKQGFKNVFIDLGNHIGNDINDKCFGWKSLIPGTMRGVYATDGGEIIVDSFYRSSRAILIEGVDDKHTERLDKEAAHRVIKTVCKACGLGDSAVARYVSRL